jgi:uncharacterized protein with NAD-binding domain and iron-sulfur cluster
MQTPRRIAILGGGVGGMTTAFELTNWPGWEKEYSVDVYQMGWRLGGKGASGRRREMADRIEEHGLHVWMGFYENAFHVIRQVYDECGRRTLLPRSPMATWRDAFLRQDYAANMEQTPSGWVPWTIHFPPNDALPGDPALFDRKAPPPTPWDLFVLAIEWLSREIDDAEQRLGERHHVPLLLRALLDRLSVDVEQPLAHVLLDVVRRLDASMTWTQFEARMVLHGLLEHIAVTVLDKIEAAVDRVPLLRRSLFLLDSGLAMARGLLADNVLEHGFTAIDGYDLMEWLTKHGARHPRNPFVLAGYDALFAYDRGDPARPNIAAGTSVYGVMRMMFTYRGSMFWRMAAGMGDTIFAPLYLVLAARGVRFHFFHRVTNLELDDTTDRIQAIEFDLQATPKDPDGYQPLYDVGGVPCWPAEPFYDQLVEGRTLASYNLESDYTPWHGQVGSKTLRAGVDFDDVVLAVPPGGAREFAGGLAAARPEWRAMFERLGTVQTQAMQLWLRRTSAELGFPSPGGQKPAITAYVEPYDTWADMSHLLDRETWTPADDVRSIAYFCNAFADDTVIPRPFTAPDFPASQLARVRAMAVTFLTQHCGVLWPDCGQPFDWSLLVNRVGATGEPALDTQYLRANIDGTERYVLSLKGTGQYRLSPGQSGFANLFLAGDWTQNVVNAGCVEAAVISGRLAAHAICGKPDHIYGAFGAQERV